MAVFAVLLKTKLFPIKKALASGSAVYTSEQIIKAAGITNKTPIFGITESSVEKRLAKKLHIINGCNRDLQSDCSNFCSNFFCLFCFILC